MTGKGGEVLGHLVIGWRTAGTWGSQNKVAEREGGKTGKINSAKTGIMSVMLDMNF